MSLLSDIGLQVRGSNNEVVVGGQVDTDSWKLNLSGGPFALLFKSWGDLKTRFTKDCWPATLHVAFLCDLGFLK